MKTLRHFLPPIFVILMRKLKFKKMLMKSRIRLYDDEKLANYIVAKTILWRNQDSFAQNIKMVQLPFLSGILMSNKKDYLKILDFGGGAGTHERLLRGFFPNIRFDWNIVETRSLVKAARDSGHFSDINFYETIGEFTEVNSIPNLIIASSSIPYSPKPLETLEKLVGVGSEHLLITRTVLNSTGVSKTYRQYSKLSSNGPGDFPAGVSDVICAYDLVVLNKVEFEKMLQTKYQILFIIDEGNISLLVDSHGEKIFSSYGYFCKILDSSI